MPQKIAPVDPIAKEFYIKYNYIREQHGELPVVSLDDIHYAWLSKRKE